MRLAITECEVPRLKIKPHTFEMCRREIPKNTVLVDSIMDVLYTYQHANSHEIYPYRFVLKVDEVTRGHALTIMLTLSMDITYAQQNHDFGYAIDWWWRTPSSAGEGELRIGFRGCGISEMIR